MYFPKLSQVVIGCFLGIQVSFLTGCSKQKSADVIQAPIIILNASGGQQFQIGSLQPKRFYKVGEGDTLYAVAWAFGLDFHKLAAINHLTPPYELHQGMRLKLDGHAFRESHPKKLIKTSLSGQYDWPIKGVVIQTFQPDKLYQLGINIQADFGSAVKSIGSGKVVYSGQGIKGYGNLIIIEHNKHLLSAYAYNKYLKVKQGEYVKRGQEIAELGLSPEGNSVLHFEIRYDGVPVNPLRFLKK